LLSKLLALDDIACKNVPQARFCCADPLPPPPLAAGCRCAIQNPLHKAKEESSPFGLLSSFGCGGGIFHCPVVVA